MHLYFSRERETAAPSLPVATCTAVCFSLNRNQRRYPHELLSQPIALCFSARVPPLSARFRP